MQKDEEEVNVTGRYAWNKTIMAPSGAAPTP